MHAINQSINQSSLTPVSAPTALSGAPSRLTVFQTASTQTVESREQGRGNSRDGQGRNPMINHAMVN